MASFTQDDNTTMIERNIHKIDDLRDIPRIQFAPSILTPQYSQLIGQGSFASVYRLHATNPPLALKVVHMTIENIGAVEQITREIRKMHTLAQHPNILKIHAYFYPEDEITIGKYIGFAMEYAAYGSLSNVISLTKRHQLEFEITWLLMLKWLREIVEALSYMHRIGEKHLDIKPENILLTSDHVVKLCDFGLTKNHGTSRSINRSLGTFGYMAYEIARGEKSQYASDLYSYGITMGYLLSYQSCPREFKGRRDKLERLNQWMKESIFNKQSGFDRLIHYLLKCLNDDWTIRPTALKMVDIISEIQQGRVEITPEDRVD